MRRIDMRLIDADALKERLEQISVVADDMYGMGINRGLDRADTAIDLMPTIDIKTDIAREIFAEIEETYKEARRTRNRLCERLKNARAEAVTEFIAWIVQDHPELEHYLNNLAEELKEGEW
jgi:hypothetical protein